MEPKEKVKKVEGEEVRDEKGEERQSNGSLAIKARFFYSARGRSPFTRSCPNCFHLRFSPSYRLTAHLCNTAHSLPWHRHAY